MGQMRELRMWRRWLIVIALGLPCVAARAEEPVAPPLLSDLVSPPLVLSLELSPDGKHIAGTAYNGWGYVFLVIDADTFAMRRLNIPPASSSRWAHRSPIHVSWAGNDVLAIDFNSLDSESVDLDGHRLAKLGERFIRRVASDGSLANQALVFSDLKDGDVDQVDVRTGQRHPYRVGLPGKPVRWAFDDQGRLRAVMMRDSSFWSDHTRISNWYRTDDAAPWQLLQEVSVNDDYWVPVRVLPEANQIAVLSREGRDTYALFRYDTVTKRHLSVMAGHPTDDVVQAGSLQGPTVDSVVTHGLKPERYWFDARWAKVQASVDAELPGRVNVVSGQPEGRVLVTSYGDVDAGRWFLLDVPTMTMREVAAFNDRIDPKRMRPMETLRYRARDGLEVPAYLTRPAKPAGEPAPMVVLIHGGPNARDTWSWNEEVQVLAAQGYVVFQPQFRGSAGFGRRFQEAGYMQWGLAMQDDITDGVREMVRRGVADPARICIYGASYGGYAALWGAIKTPEIYRCGVSLAGVSDLEAWVAGSIFDDSDRLARELKRARIGDPSSQREQFDRVSPLKNAARVGIPLLIAHGEEDTRVLPSQSEKMVAALKANGKSVEWLPLPGEGHGLYYTDNKKRYYAALLSFLQRYIGDTNRPAPTTAAAPTAPAAASAAAPS
jgi:dipeptidyl aminopeptidase/acylaminoacyl peptidase